MTKFIIYFDLENRVVIEIVNPTIDYNNLQHVTYIIGYAEAESFDSLLSTIKIIKGD